MSQVGHGQAEQPVGRRWRSRRSHHQPLESKTKTSRWRSLKPKAAHLKLWTAASLFPPTWKGNAAWWDLPSSRWPESWRQTRWCWVVKAKHKPVPDFSVICHVKSCANTQQLNRFSSFYFFVCVKQRDHLTWLSLWRPYQVTAKRFPLWHYTHFLCQHEEYRTNSPSASSRITKVTMFRFLMKNFV